MFNSAVLSQDEKIFTSQPALFATHERLDYPALYALDEVERAIDWPAPEPLLPEGKGETGRPRYAALTLLRVLLLGLWRAFRGGHSNLKLEA